MNYQSNLARNLTTMRSMNNLTLERVAEAVGVSRQAVAKWESGESAPDILHCDALAELYGISLDDLVHFDREKEGMPPPPRGKHIFGAVQVGERGQIVIPKRARDMFGIKPGDMLLVLGDTNPGTAGIALMQRDTFFGMKEFVEAALRRGDD